MQEKMKTVLIPRGRKNEENFVLVSVNGRNFKIMKGVEVQVPEFVAQVLENARMMEDDARDSENHEDKENGLRLIEVNELTHPSDHRSEELTDQGKQRGKNRSSRALKSSSFHKNIYGTCHGRSRRTNIEKTAAKIMK